MFNMNIQIEKGIEIPKFDTKSMMEKETPIASMEISDSFLYPATTKQEDNNIIVRVATYGKAVGKTFLTRKVEGGRRVWRMT